MGTFMIAFLISDSKITMGDERAPTPAASDDEPMPDGAEPSRLAKSAGDRRPARCGAWNAQAARMLQDGVLAARLGGGGTVTVTYGGIMMAVEVKHERAAGQPALVSATQELRLRALEAQPPEQRGGEFGRDDGVKQRREVAQQHVDGARVHHRAQQLDVDIGIAPGPELRFGRLITVNDSVSPGEWPSMRK